MNTNENNLSAGGEEKVKLLLAAGNTQDKTEDIIIVHEVEIITPQPYGVFALCKIIEHLQIN